MSMNLPLLPGHRFSDPYKQTYHKIQVFHLKSSTFDDVTFAFLFGTLNQIL